LNEDIDSPSEIFENSGDGNKEIEGDANDYIDILDAFDRKNSSDYGGATKHDVARTE